MHQIKIFKGVENDLSSLEKQVNAWLVESEARVLGVFGNMSPQSIPAGVTSPGLTNSAFAPSDVLLVIHYEKVLS